MLNKQKVLINLKQNGKVRWGKKKTLELGLEKMKKKKRKYSIVHCVCWSIVGKTNLLGGR